MTRTYATYMREKACRGVGTRGAQLDATLFTGARGVELIAQDVGHRQGGRNGDGRSQSRRALWTEVVDAQVELRTGERYGWAQA